MDVAPIKQLRAVIIDDEPGCIANLEQYSANCCPGLTVVDTATTLDAGSALLQRQDFDIAFLDIQMAHQTSFEVLDASVERRYALIFVTAYEQYALRAFGAGAVDYLTKPLHEPDLVRAYRKAQQYLGVLDRPDLVPPTVKAPQKIILTQGEQVYVVPLADVLYFKGSGFYTHVHFHTPSGVKRVTVSKPLSLLEREHDHPPFFRIHKSCIVNINHIATLLRGDVLQAHMADGVTFPVARRRATEFLSFLKTPV